MKIDGKDPVAAGGVVLRFGETVTIDFDGTPAVISFDNNGGTPNLNVDFATKAITLSNYDGAELGSFTGGPLEIGGVSYILRFGVWAMGNPVNGRFLQYAITRG